MAMLTKEELKAKISEKISDDELQIELLEDVEDSFKEEVSVEEDEKYKALESSVEDYKTKYEEIKEKYRTRFLTSDEEGTNEEETEELKEEEIIDIQEI